MAGKVLPGAKFSGSSSGSSGSGGREFSTRESKTLPGLTGVDPYDHSRSAADYLRDGAVTAEKAAEIHLDETKQESDSSGADKQKEQQAAPGRDVMPTWEEELAQHPGDINKAYRLHMEGMARQFKAELMKDAENELTLLSEQSRTAVTIERERKNTIDYAMAAYGDQANLQGISNRAMVSQQVNAREMTGPGVGLSFKINQGLSGGKDSLVRLPNGSQVEMDSRVAALVTMNQPGRQEEKSSGMAAMFGSYIVGKDPGFMKAVESAGGIETLGRNGELQFDRGEEEKLASLWQKVVESQKDEMSFEAKPTDKLTPKEYEALGLDASKARDRRLKEYGDPSEALGVIYDHEFEYNGRPLPTPAIVGQSGRQKEKGDQELAR